jgi:hypothetical protein
MFFLISIILTFTAPVLQIILCAQRLKYKIKLPLWASTLLTFTMGLILPVAATMIASYALSPTIKCAEGIELFAVLGIFLTVTTIPLIGIISYIKFRMKNKVIIF